MNDLARAILKLRPGAIWSLDGNDYENLQWLDTNQTKPTIEEITDCFNQIEVEDSFNALKQDRVVEVNSLKVTTTAGNTFDGDEVSQGRMSRAITSMNPEDTVLWVLANNTVINVTQAELKEALRLAGTAMSEIWVRPYT